MTNMPHSDDYRTYLELHFKTIHETLERIEEQTVKTNGRVTKLEDEFKDVSFFARHPWLFLGVVIVLTLMAISGGITSIIK